MPHRPIARPLFPAALLIAAISSGASPVERPAADVYEPTSRYEVRQVEGWTVLVHKGFLADEPALAERTISLLGRQLDEIIRRVPAGALEKLRTIRIWVEEAEPHHPCMAYHPDAGWLTEHGMNPEKAGCVELANARNFSSWTLDQPWMVLHELAHGFHHQHLEGAYENKDVEGAYRRAMEAKRYDSVLRLSGRKEKAYAATNPMEYFAEATEAYFGTNDFYPFVRPELAEHDPELAELLARLWGVR
ncbi:hypothetical protein EP7_004743 [Isosphaeraceae bacterium EP7]